MASFRLALSRVILLYLDSPQIKVRLGTAVHKGAKNSVSLFISYRHNVVTRQIGSKINIFIDPIAERVFQQVPSCDQFTKNFSYLMAAVLHDMLDIPYILVPDFLAIPNILGIPDILEIPDILSIPDIIGIPIIIGIPDILCIPDIFCIPDIHYIPDIVGIPDITESLSSL